eukprot:SAG11_NODE_1943_length_4020_cov_8.087733_3_plen_77_part_00
MGQRAAGTTWGRGGFAVTQGSALSVREVTIDAAVRFRALCVLFHRLGFFSLVCILVCRVLHGVLFLAKMIIWYYAC